MKMPGFTAEISLSTKSRASYIGSCCYTAAVTGILPQLWSVDCHHELFSETGTDCELVWEAGWQTGIDIRAHGPDPCLKCKDRCHHRNLSAKQLTSCLANCDEAAC